MTKIDIKSLTYEELKDYVASLGEPSFRAKQIFEWLHRGVISFDEMTNLSKAAREKFSAASYISYPVIENKLVSKIDGTVKYLFRLNDGECVETVVMRYNHGISICVSTEVGCKMGCAFCASTIGGIVRKLTAGEIADQVIFSQKDLGERIDSIVLMGIGEPLDNFENVIKFIKNINDENGLNIGMRHISLSTCGIVPKIRELEALNLPITLSISLHATDNDKRSKIMPVNNKYPIEELIKACKSYTNTTGRRISFEYAVISGVNDGIHDAATLCELLKGMLAHVNVIPVNEVAGKGFVKPDRAAIDKFVNYINEHGISATVRRKLGSDINAACGQLRRQSKSKGVME